MKLQILVDNNTYIDEYYLGEPAVCYYIEEEDERILFDLGYSDVFIKNAEKMAIDLNQISKIVLSHGHNDHTGGFAFLNGEMDLSVAEIIAHPCVFEKKYDNNMEIGSPLSLFEAEQKYALCLSKEPFQISSKLFFLGEIPSYNDFEERSVIGKRETDEELMEDFVLEDTAIVYKSEKGLFIITGCSHSGICNIIEHAKKVCNETKIAGVLGGFHLFDVNERLNKTIEYFIKSNITELYPCHCVSFQVKAEINKKIKIHEVGVGMIIEL